MNFEVTEAGPCRRHVSVEVEPELVEDRVKEQIKEFRRTKTLPGFRPGRATESVVRRRFGKQIRAEVLQDLIPEAWSRKWSSSYLLMPF